MLQTYLIKVFFGSATVTLKFIHNIKMLGLGPKERGVKILDVTLPD